MLYTGKHRAVVLVLMSGLAGVMGGCKLAVISGEGGTVTSLSGSHDCPVGSYCVAEITAAPYSETFTANPLPGYQFVRWQDGLEFQCGGSTNPSCTVTIAAGPLGAAVVASYGVNYVMPIFKDVGIDTDGDGVPDRDDEDDDNDGILDVDDPCPLFVNCGTDTIEQTVISSCGTGGNFIYQSFTATVTGEIREFYVAADNAFGQLGYVVYEGSDDTGPEVTSGTNFLHDQGDGFHRIPTLPPYEVTQGQMYTVRLGAPAVWEYCGSPTDEYAGGAATVDPGPFVYDLGFKVEIDYAF